MTTNRTRELAKKILDRAWLYGRSRDEVSEAEAAILAYRAEVRRETLKEVKARSVIAPNFDSLTPEARDASLHAVYLQRGAFRAMLDEMIAEAGPAESRIMTAMDAPGVTVGRYPDGCLSPLDCGLSNPAHCVHPGSACPHARARTDHDWIGAALRMLIDHFPAISDRDRVFWADVKREWPDVG